MQRRALVVDDEALVAALLKNMLSAAGFEVELAHTAGDASEAFETFDPDIAILDISLGPGPSGLDIAYMASQSYPGVALLLLSRYPDLRTAHGRPIELPAHCGFISKDSVADTPGADVMATTMNAAWVRFIKGEDPGGGALPTWPQYDLDAREVMILDKECRVESDPWGDLRQAWTGVQ